MTRELKLLMTKKENSRPSGGVGHDVRPLAQAQSHTMEVDKSSTLVSNDVALSMGADPKNEVGLANQACPTI